MVNLWQGIGLTLKIRKHLENGENDKAAMYFAARSFRDGKPDEGSAEEAQLAQLKELGYKFGIVTDVAMCQKFKVTDGDVIAIRPSGKWYSGRDMLKKWDNLF